MSPPDPSTTQTVTTALGPIGVRVAGSGGTTVLLWPSIFTDSHIFDQLASDLSSEATFLLVDGPGHGASGGPHHSFSMADCAGIISSVLDAFGVDRAFVGGVSWGGIAAADFARARPQRTSGVILMNTPMSIDRRSPGLQARFIAFGARWLLSTSAFRNGVAASFFSKQTLHRDTAYASHFHDVLRSADPRALSAAVRSVILEGDPLKDRLHELSMPTLVIAGREDAMYPVDEQAESASRLANGQFKPVPGKHISPLEAPAETAALIAAFLGARGRGRLDP